MIVNSHDVTCDTDNLQAMKQWYSFYANKIRDEKLVRSVQEMQLNEQKLNDGQKQK